MFKLNAEKGILLLIVISFCAIISTIVGFFVAYRVGMMFFASQESEATEIMYPTNPTLISSEETQCYAKCYTDGANSYGESYYDVGEVCIGLDQYKYTCQEDGLWEMGDKLCVGQCKRNEIPDDPNSFYEQGTICTGMDDLCYHCEASGQFSIVEDSKCD